MLEILSITTPIYAIMIIGFVMVRTGLFAKPELRILGKFVFNLALPALVFKALAERQFAEILNLGYLAAYALGCLVVVAIGYVWSRRVGGQAPLTATVSAMGMSCSNSGYIGYPVLLLALPSVAGIALALNVLVENLLLLPMLLSMAERRQDHGSAGKALRELAKRMLSNPLVIGLAAGLAVSLLGIPLPKAAAQTVGVLASASGAVSLFIVGGTLVDLPVRKAGPGALAVVFGKLLLHPLAMLGAIALVPLLGLPGLDPTLKTALLLSAAVPMMSIYTTLGQKFGQEEFCAVAQLLTTAASFVTLSALLWTVEHLTLFR